MTPLTEIVVEGTLLDVFDPYTAPSGASNRKLWVECQSAWGPQVLQVEVRGPCALHEFHKGRVYSFNCRLWGKVLKDRTTGVLKNVRSLQCACYKKLPLAPQSQA